MLVSQFFQAILAKLRVEHGDLLLEFVHGRLVIGLQLEKFVRRGSFFTFGIDGDPVDDLAGQISRSSRDNFPLRHHPAAGIAHLLGAGRFHSPRGLRLNGIRRSRLKP